MSESNDRELFISEYRHEIVAKFSRAIIEGSRTMTMPPQYFEKGREKDREDVRLYMSQLILDIGQYFSGKLSGQELDKIEQSIFQKMVFLQSISALPQKNVSVSRIEEQIAALRTRQDSTNNLLLQITTILKELLRSRND